MPAAEECIALATDEGYVPQACVVLASYALSNPLNRRDIFVFINRLSEDGRRMLLTTGDAFGLRLMLREMDGDWVREIDKHLRKGLHHVSEAAYGKLLIPRSLPESYRRCLILDCDMLIRGDINPLFETNLGGMTLGACSDAGQSDKSLERLGMPMDGVYFNSGMLLVDLRRWRSDKPLLSLSEVIGEKRDRMVYLEQDILNLLFQGRFRKMDPKWNAIMMIIPRGYVRNWKGSPSDQAILHFAGELKPWHEFYHPAMRSMYLAYPGLCSWIRVPTLGPAGKTQLRAATMLAEKFGLKDLLRKYTQQTKDDSRGKRDRKLH